MNKEYFIKLLTDKKILFGLFFVLLGIFISSYYFNKDKIESKADLTEVSGIIQNYYFKHLSGHKSRTTNSYFLYLNGYNNNFRVIDEFYNHFNQVKFENSIRSGDRVKLYVAAVDKDKLNTNCTITVFGIKSNDFVFLDYNLSIYEYSSKVSLYVGLVLLIIGLDIFYNNREKFKLLKNKS